VARNVLRTVGGIRAVDPNAANPERCFGAHRRVLEVLFEAVQDQGEALR
jgi:hypothetical protein